MRIVLAQPRLRCFLAVKCAISRPIPRFRFSIQFTAMSTTSSPSPTSTSSPDSESDIDKHLRKSVDQINEWLKKCRREHDGTRCTATTPQSNGSSASVRARALPKRLIDLSSPTAKLVPTPSPLPKYAILSYVWGTEGDNFCTLRSNLSQMETEIPSSALPLTLQHVFQLVRQLDLKYLWVDALCIIQDDENDITTEIVNMASTYINAYLQIAAMSSPGAHHGLFSFPGAQADDEELSLEEHHEIMKVCRSLRQKDWDSTLHTHYRLLTRGWTFQERILARRVVHFTKKELVWECKSERWCKCGGIGNKLDKGHALINNMSAALEACMMLSETNFMERKGRISPLWRECVMSYSKRNLGKASDRLPAISGIAALLVPPGVNGQGEEEYIAGLWKEAMPFDLLWRCDQTSRLKERKIFKPSWSWGSVHCGVSWPRAAAKRTAEIRLPPSNVDSSLEKSLTYLSSGTYFEHELVGVRVVSVDVEPLHSRLGEIKEGVVVLSSRKVRVQIRKRYQLMEDKSEDENKHDYTEWVVEKRDQGVNSSESSLPFYPDVQFSEDGQEVGDKECKEYWLVEIASARDDEIGRIWEAGLVVRRAGDSGHDSAYERVGIAGYSVCEPREGVSWFVSEPEDVMLI